MRAPHDPMTSSVRALGLLFSGLGMFLVVLDGGRLNPIAVTQIFLGAILLHGSRD